jgi:hypothetical protein
MESQIPDYNVQNRGYTDRRVTRFSLRAGLPNAFPSHAAGGLLSEEMMMKPVPCRSLLVLISVVMLSSQSSASEADSNEPVPALTKQQVLDAWKQREQRLEAAQFKWTDARIYSPGSIIHPACAKLYDLKGNAAITGIPEERLEATIPSELWVRGKWMRYSSETPAIARDCELNWQRYCSSYDGISSRMLFVPKGVMPPERPRIRGSIRNESKNTDTRCYLLVPLQLYLKPLKSQKQFELDFRDQDEMHLSQEAEPIDGRSYPVLENSTTQLCFDPSRDFVIVRCSAYRPDGQLSFRADISYKEDPRHGWIPSGWKIESFNPDGSGALHRSNAATVTDYKINPPLKQEDFHLEFPVGTRVYDSTTGEEYIVGEDGKKRKIEPNRPKGDV